MEGTLFLLLSSSTLTFFNLSRPTSIDPFLSTLFLVHCLLFGNRSCFLVRGPFWIWKKKIQKSILGISFPSMTKWCYVYYDLFQRSLYIAYWNPFHQFLNLLNDPLSVLMEIEIHWRQVNTPFSAHSPYSK